MESKICAQYKLSTNFTEKSTECTECKCKQEVKRYHVKKHTVFDHQKKLSKKIEKNYYKNKQKIVNLERNVYTLYWSTKIIKSNGRKYHNENESEKK